MCGIAACLTNKLYAKQIVINSLLSLENRGYDSAGIVYVENNCYKLEKFVSDCTNNAVQKLCATGLVHTGLCLGHTRWATHGFQTIENAHPHSDDSARFFMVHNGIIENHALLREELIERGYSFYGQTDTEVAVKYLHLLIARGERVDDLCHYLRGSWAMLVVDSCQMDTIYFLKNESPLIIGLNRDCTQMTAVSELSGFDAEIVSYIILNNNECGSCQLVNGKCQITTRQSYTPIPFGGTNKDHLDGFNHWTLKEIHYQPTAIGHLLKTRIVNNELHFPELAHLQNRWANITHVIFLACGTSYHAAQMGAKYFKIFHPRLFVQVIDGADFESSDVYPDQSTLLLLISQSGETKDLHRALQISKQFPLVYSVGLINVVQSLIAREVDCVLYLQTGRENAVASTKSFTNAVVLCCLLAMVLTSSKPAIYDDYLIGLQNLPNQFEQIMEETNFHLPQMIKILENKPHIFLLGRGELEWVAREGALKMKEIAYVHAEGFSTATLKHGPFALLTASTPVILLVHNDVHSLRIESAIAEIKCRHAPIVCISAYPYKQSTVDYLFHSNIHSPFYSLLTVVPLQFIAYHLSLSYGINPDYPRNLAKVVTVY